MSVVVASTLALIGAFFALVVTIFALITIFESIDPAAAAAEEYNLGLYMGFCLLMLILFIAVAGSLNSNGQWSWRLLIFMEVLCTAVPVVAYLFDVVDIPSMVALVVIGSLMVVFTTTTDSRRWVESDRI